MHPTLTRLSGARGIVTIAALASLTLIGACLNTDKLTGTTNGGAFTASVSGDLTGGLAGTAEVIQLTPTGATAPNAVALGLLDPSGAVLAFQWSGRTTLSAGTYNLGSDSTTTTQMVLVLANGTRYLGTGGTITLDSATTATVKGSFTGNAVSIDSTQHLAISGNFSAAVVGGTH